MKNIRADIMVQIMYHFLFVIARTQNNVPYTVVTITLRATLYGKKKEATMTQAMWDPSQRYNVDEGAWTLSIEIHKSLSSQQSV